MNTSVNTHGQYRVVGTAFSSRDCGLHKHSILVINGDVPLGGQCYQSGSVIKFGSRTHVTLRLTTVRTAYTSQLLYTVTLFSDNKIRCTTACRLAVITVTDPVYDLVLNCEV